MINEQENLIDRLLADLEPLREFILPGGTQSAAALHLARTIARRAERAVVTLGARDEINPNCLIYLNRASDLLFVLARIVNHRTGGVETPARFSKRKWNNHYCCHQYQCDDRDRHATAGSWSCVAHRDAGVPAGTKTPRSRKLARSSATLRPSNLAIQPG